VVPCVHYTAPNMFAFRRCLLNTRCLSNVNRKLALGPRVLSDQYPGSERKGAIRYEESESSEVDGLGMINIPSCWGVAQRHFERRSAHTVITNNGRRNQRNNMRKECVEEGTILS